MTNIFLLFLFFFMMHFFMTNSFLLFLRVSHEIIFAGTETDF